MYKIHHKRFIIRFWIKKILKQLNKLANKMFAENDVIFTISKISFRKNLTKNLEKK